MRSLRFLALVVAILSVYAAQYLFDQSSLEFLRSPWFSTNLPLLRDFYFWSPADKQALGLYLAAIGALLFGLITYSWSSASGFPEEDTPTPSHRFSGIGPLLAVAGLLGGAVLLVYFWQNQAEPAWTHYLWILALVVYLLGIWRMGGNRPSPDKDASPEQSWPVFLLILAISGLLLGWQLPTVPVRVDGDTASHGLQALQIVAGLEDRIFASGWANIPLFAYYPAALGITLSGDWLFGNRLAGLYAGLLTILGVWLLGGELFRRSPKDGTGDDGRIPALLAAAFTGVGYTFVHFGRMPQYMEPVAWGVLGLWALQRGVRTRSLPTLALSGLLLGLTGTLYYSGRIFGVIALLWWLWFLLARRDGLHRLGWAGFGAWAGGGFTFLSPFLGAWLRSPGDFTTRLQEVSLFNPGGLAHMEGVYGVQGINGVLVENARRAFLTFWMYGDKSTHFGWPGPLLDSLIAPVLLLGVGYLLLNLDRVHNWQLLSWLAAVVVLGGVLTINTPFWPRLLPALPVAGLICALAVDRARSALMESGASWLGQFSLFVVMGLLVLAGAHNWVAWYEVQTVYGDPESYAGRAVRSLPDERTAVLIDTGDDRRAQWSDRTVRFLAGGPYAGKSITIHPESWPESLPPLSSVILQPDDQTLAAELQSRYPGGIFLLQRNRTGDPVLFAYQLP